MGESITIPIRRRPRPPQVQRTPRVQRTPVLAVLHADNFVEIHGENLDVHVALMLDAEGVPAAERTAAEYLAVSLPRRFRPLYHPEKPTAVGQCEQRSPEAELSRIRELRIVRGLREIRESKTPSKRG